MKQQTFWDIVEQENLSREKASDRYWNYFEHACEAMSLFWNMFESLDLEKHLFVAYYWHMQRHLMLWLLSSIRQHHVQVWMNLRQVLEAWARSLYSMGNTSADEFYEFDENWALLSDKKKREKLEDKRNEWLNANYPEDSKIIKRLKKLINETTAHCNITYVISNFNISQNWSEYALPFFDEYNEFTVKNDLWFIGNLVRWFVWAFICVNRTHTSWVLAKGIQDRYRILVETNDKLKKQMEDYYKWKWIT